MTSRMAAVGMATNQEPNTLTPPQWNRARAQVSSPIPERYKQRKQRRPFRTISVVEGINDLQGAAAEQCEDAGTAPKKPCSRDIPQERRIYRRLSGGSAEAAEVALERLRTDFAVDYFTAPSHAKLSGALVTAAMQVNMADRQTAGSEQITPQLQATPHAEIDVTAQSVVAKRGDGWLRLMQMGFGLLMHGVGSKRQLLEHFADRKILPWGAAVVRIDGFNMRLSLADCLRDVIEKMHPNMSRVSSSVESLVERIRAARRTMPSPARPLCLVAHSLELLPQAHQTALAHLAASPGVHLVASVDSIWAPLAWNPRCLKDFNFCWEEVHTHDGYDAEAAARYAGGMPAWCNPSASRQRSSKASIGLVLRSLTSFHRELVQAMARHQLDDSGRTGISTNQLLAIASDRMIADNITKLRNLLNELKAHDMVVQRAGTNGCVLYLLRADLRTLRRLAEGQAPDESEGEESGREEEV